MRPKLGQISHFLTTVKLEDGWAKCLNKSVVQSSAIKVSILRFPTCCRVSEPQCVESDWCQKSTPNLVLFDPLPVKFRGGMSEMSE